MFGLGWAEIMVVGVVALIVIGPKELPVVFRKVGQFIGKAKAMAREFTTAMNEAADESGLKEAVDTVNDGVSGINEVSQKNWTDFIPGSETEKLAKKRVAKSKKLHVDATKKVQRNVGANGIETPKIKEPEVADTFKKKFENKKNITKNKINQSIASKVITKETNTKAGPKSRSKTTLKKAVKDTALKDNDLKPGKLT
ncbi:Sec-independent protein translocase protein TatB [Planktomarina sp.]|jgi:sec-independent protein translocase protein TatB|nr:Sec-independent protein translocase protein TatB [Planktomarina sp.]|tara:strand:- start:763 stop:1356 length:594 start_codon:yes stop_codon:yes gene_type:complete